MPSLLGAITMRMNGDQEGRTEKWVGVLSSVVAPALPGALCAALTLSIDNILFFTRIPFIDLGEANKKRNI
jgi:hypothetical protein